VLLRDLGTLRVRELAPALLHAFARRALQERDVAPTRARTDRRRREHEVLCVGGRYERHLEARTKRSATAEGVHGRSPRHCRLGLGRLRSATHGCGRRRRPGATAAAPSGGGPCRNSLLDGGARQATRVRTVEQSPQHRRAQGSLGPLRLEVGRQAPQRGRTVLP
jgi:hypothetical protein